MEYYSIEKLIQMRGLAGKHHAIVNLTSQFIASDNKERWFGEENQPVDKQSIDQYAVFDELAPIENTDDINILEYLIKENHSLGSFVATGGEIPRTSGGTVMTVQGKAVKLGLSIEYDEETRLKIYQMSQIPNLPQGLVELIFGNTKNLMIRTSKLFNVIFAQLLYRGRIDYTDPRTNVRLQFALDTESQLFPAPLTAGDVWSNPTTGNAIVTIQRLAEAWYDIHGYYPESVFASRKAINHALAQQATASAATSIGMNYAYPTASSTVFASLKMLNEILALRGLPILRQWDAQYEIEIAPRVTQRGRYFPDNVIFFGNKRMGKRLYLPTIESIDKGEPKGGLHQQYIPDKKTGTEENRVVGRVFPFIKDVRQLAAQTVF
ncbi:MAG: hypothetical protein ACRDBG_08410 [Waterburya sp.]